MTFASAWPKATIFAFADAVMGGGPHIKAMVPSSAGNT
eukprot:CAMPEP_0177498456 /NCGR_PEP_ID=MMETSP0369-20130122/35590_1 /TAXON_ID=447022 ORGANISM="Scrippsiella hangoei-like, Strain SHHI-4" /NCGR_SAMPLE_ID=MMETSP0369 /ASSEMBLY_ACC=CAM_ASM_000364 /LENGTH=37 /DNA_ID= /DNA_START= /DNA_END= /DNA_ORIENTATION=